MSSVPENRYRRIPACLIAAVFFILLPGCRETDEVMKEDIRTVKVEKVAGQSGSRTVSYPARIVAAKEARLSFRIAGPIDSIYVKAGDFVRKGDTVASIQERDYLLQFSATEAEYRQIKAEAERVIELAGRNSATKNDHDKAYYGLQQITAKYEAHKNALADTRMTAPFDCFVETVFFHAGETVGAGMPVVSVIGDEAPEAVVNLPSSDYIIRDRIRKSYCTVDAYPGLLFPLRLSGINRTANLNQLFQARLTLAPVSGTIPSPGMSANVFIEYEDSGQNYVSVPISALFKNGEGSGVWVIDKESRVRKRSVVPADIRRDGTVLIADGLEAGESIVTAGVHSLKDGQKVRPVTGPSATNIGGIL